MSLHQVTPTLSTAIHCWGDSLTEATSGSIALPSRWPVLLGQSFTPQRTVNNFGVGGDTAAQIAVRQLLYLPINNVINVIWAGRNGVLTLTPAAIVATIQTMVAAVTTSRYLILTVPFITDGSEDANDASGILVQALNDLIIATYPNNYVDLATVLGRTDALRGDTVHPNTAGQALIAPAIYAKIIAKGW